MIPLYYYSWPPVLWLDWWCHHAAQSGQSSTLSMNLPEDPRILSAPQSAAFQSAASKPVDPEPAAPEGDDSDTDNRVIPFPFDRVKHKARSEGQQSATLIILAPRAS